MPQPVAPLILQPFAKNAVDPDYIELPIPISTGDPGRASWDLGFPPLTMTEILAGGKPPFGQDMNGVLYTATAHLAALQAGQLYKYDATVAAAMGGYQRAAVLGMADNSGVWINCTDNNATDPDAGGAGWIPLFAQGLADVNGLVGGTRTLTTLEVRRAVIVLSGSLAGNQVIIMPPNQGTTFREWLVVNLCTQNGFAVTVKTNPAGTGVVVPSGGYAAPTGVYGNATDCFPIVAPITIPTDVNPTPDTIALRTNNGYLFATYVNTANGVEPFSAIGVYGSAGDGYHRLLSLTNLAAQISLASFAGQVVPAQVPAAAVTQYASLLWTNAALDGTPTAPTAPPATDNTQVATTAFVQSLLTRSIGGNGWVKIGGIYIQWGYVVGPAGGPGSATFAFPMAFPNGCLCLLTQNGYRNGGSNGSYVRGFNAATGTAVFDVMNEGPNNGFRGGFFIAIGY